VVALPLIARNLAVSARRSAGAVSTPLVPAGTPVIPDDTSPEVAGAPEAAANEGTGETPAASI